MTTLESVLYESIHEVDENQWNNLVEQSDYGSVFQRYGWLETLEDALGLEGRHVVVTKDTNPIALLPNVFTDLEIPAAPAVTNRLPIRTLVSLDPGYGGPVISSNERKSLRLLLDRIPETCGPGVVYHAISAGNLEYIRYGKYLEKRGYRPTMTGCRFRQELSVGWDRIKDEMHKERRRALRNADETGYDVVDEDLTDDRLAEVYREYEKNMDRIDGNTFPLAFLRGLRDNLHDRLRVFTAVVDDQAVGSYIYLLDEERSTVHHYLSAIGDSDYYEFHPTEILHAHAIQWAIDQGYDYYDHGGTGAAFDENVFRYKEKFGGEAIPTLRWEKGQSALSWNAFKLGRSIYQKKSY